GWRVPARPGDAGDSYPEIGVESGPHSTRHGARRRLAHRPLGGQDGLGHPQQVHLDLVGVAHDSTLEERRNPGQIGDRSREPAPGAAFGDGELVSARVADFLQLLHEPRDRLCAHAGDAFRSYSVAPVTRTRARVLIGRSPSTMTTPSTSGASRYER